MEGKYGKHVCKSRIHMALVALVLLGAFNWGTTALGYNLVKLFNNKVNELAGTNYPISKVIYFVVAAAAGWLALNKYTWLPFLGCTVLPESLVPLRVPENPDTQVTINTKPNAKIVYWAALPSKTVQSVENAYGNFSNSGAVMSDANGKAVLPLVAGSGYVLPSGQALERHVHYRVAGYHHGSMMGKLKTVYY